MIRTTIPFLLCAFLFGACENICFAKTHDSSDPLEPLNRKIFQFNYDLDVSFYRPIAKFYSRAVHPKAQKSITNVFNTIDEIPSLANSILQLDGHRIVVNTWRFVINTTLGLLGTVDVASRLGLPPHKNDFGLTLHKWGFKKSPYLQVLFLGPSTLRDAVGMGVDLPLRPTFYIASLPTAYTISAFRAVPIRADLLSANNLIDEAIDPYVFVRDAYLQKRKEDIRKMCKQKEKEEEEEALPTP